MALLDSDKAVGRIGNMWRRLGTLYEGAAYDAAAKGLYERAIDCARKAEVCFWQATGESDTLDWRDLGFKRAEGQ